jgi:hypothetical protein
LLTTTRSVRKRLDLTRPVQRDVILDCLRSSGRQFASNMQNWHFPRCVAPVAASL